MTLILPLMSYHVLFLRSLPVKLAWIFGWP